MNLKNRLAKLESDNGISYHIIVVDNNSDHDEIEKAKSEYCYEKNLDINKAPLIVFYQADIDTL